MTDLGQKLAAARRLPQHRDQWQYVTKPLRLWAESPSGETIRPRCLLVLELYPRGQLRAHRFAEDPARAADRLSAEQVLRFLLDEMLAPQREGDERHRPASVSFVDRELAHALAEPLRRVLAPAAEEEADEVDEEGQRRQGVGGRGGKARQWTPPVLVEADGVRDFMKKYAENMVSKGKGVVTPASEQDGLLRSLASGGAGGDNADDVRLVGRFFELAAELYRRAPWTERLVPESALFRIEHRGAARDNRSDVWFLAVLGSEGGDRQNAAGFVGLPSVRAARKRWRAAATTAARKGGKDEGGVDDADNTEVPYVPAAASSAGHHDDDGDDVDADGIPLPVTVFCAYSGDVLPGPYALRCSHCRAAYYRDQAAQRADWPRHAAECRAPARATASSPDQTRSVAPIKRPFWRQSERVMLYMDESALPFDDLDDIEAHAWPVVTDRAHGSYPVPFVTVSGGALLQPKVTRPGRRELRWMIDVMQWMVTEEGGDDGIAKLSRLAGAGRQGERGGAGATAAAATAVEEEEEEKEEGTDDGTGRFSVAFVEDMASAATATTTSDAPAACAAAAESPPEVSRSSSRNAADGGHGHGSSDDAPSISLADDGNDHGASSPPPPHHQVGTREVPLATVVAWRAHADELRDRLVPLADIAGGDDGEGENEDEGAPPHEPAADSRAQRQIDRALDAWPDTALAYLYGCLTRNTRELQLGIDTHRHYGAIRRYVMRCVRPVDARSGRRVDDPDRAGVW